MEGDAQVGGSNQRSYTPADVRELGDVLASRRCALPLPHPRFTVDNDTAVLLLANEHRALEVANISYLAEGLPLRDAVRFVGLAVAAGNCLWLPSLIQERPELLPRSEAQFFRYVRACLSVPHTSPLWPCTGATAAQRLGITPVPSRFSQYAQASQWAACLQVYSGGACFERIFAFVQALAEAVQFTDCGSLIRVFLRELPTGSRLSSLLIAPFVTALALAGHVGKAAYLAVLREFDGPGSTKFLSLYAKDPADHGQLKSDVASTWPVRLEDIEQMSCSALRSHAGRSAMGGATSDAAPRREVVLWLPGFPIARAAQAVDAQLFDTVRRLWLSHSRRDPVIRCYLVAPTTEAAPTIIPSTAVMEVADVNRRQVLLRARSWDGDRSLIDGLTLNDLPAAEAPIIRQQYQQAFGACGLSCAGRGTRQVQPSVDMMQRIVPAATKLKTDFCDDFAREMGYTDTFAFSLAFGLPKSAGAVAGYTPTSNCHDARLGVSVGCVSHRDTQNGAGDTTPLSLSGCVCFVLLGGLWEPISGEELWQHVFSVDARPLLAAGSRNDSLLLGSQDLRGGDFVLDDYGFVVAVGSRGVALSFDATAVWHSVSALQAGWRWCLGLYDRKVETTLGSRLSEWLSRLLLVPDQQRAWHVRGLHLWLVPAGQLAAVLTRVEWLTAQTMQFRDRQTLLAVRRAV
eukprot:COSAG02_NODE_3547_length_6582_cov_6.857319_4_plen_686_part_00